MTADTETRREHSHQLTDLHELGRLVAELTEWANATYGQVTELRRELAELTATVGRLEAEFAPVARSMTGRAAMATANILSRRRGG